MKISAEKYQTISTILAFALIPLSGFATDIYIPSLPAMAVYFGVTSSAVQLSLVVFMISSGVSQLFVGSLLDTLGRYRPGIISLLVFAVSSCLIANATDIQIVYSMRILQGIAVAIIVVGKRAYFIDTYSGEKLKHFTSLFSIVWATAPVIAPFIGGYLQSVTGWQANFYFLCIVTSALLILELIYSKESLKVKSDFDINQILKVYLNVLRTPDFTLGILIISFSYAMLIIYGMSSPFIIEHVYHCQPVITGYCALISGISLMSGGIISKILMQRSLTKKLICAIFFQLLLALLMMLTTKFESTLITLMAFTAAIHLLSGFVFNNVFAYCLGRFSKNAGIISGLTGGSLFALTSLLSYGTVSLITVKNQFGLGLAFLLFGGISLLVLGLFIKAKNKYNTSNAVAIRVFK